MAPLLVPVLLKPEWYRHLVMPANSQRCYVFVGIAAASPALTLPECSLSAAGNIFVFCQILQALCCRLVAKLSDLHKAIVYLETFKTYTSVLYID